LADVTIKFYSFTKHLPKMSKIISNLEVLTKPIAPKLGLVQTTDTDPISRTAVQGYFLTVSNLRSVPLRFELGAIVSPNAVAGDEIYRTFSSISLNDPTLPPPLDNSNYVIATDIGGDNTFSLFAAVTGAAPNALKYRTPVFTLPPHQTISVQILPNVLNDALRAAAKTEIRGYVSIDSAITVEIIPVSGGLGLGLIQFTRPEYDVQLTVEYRGTIIPNTGSIQETDQITSAMGTYRIGEPKRFIRPFVFDRELSADFQLRSVLNLKERPNKRDLLKLAKEAVAADESLKGYEDELVTAIEAALKKRK
jgi:hypothetical protein